jgi:hypothetical protein
MDAPPVLPRRPTLEQRLRFYEAQGQARRLAESEARAAKSRTRGANPPRSPPRYCPAAPPADRCICCGDPAVHVSGRFGPICLECLAELHFGWIAGPAEPRTCGGYRRAAEWRGEPSPWQENAIRCLEDG